jgi:hypothetical protein
MERITAEKRQGLRIRYLEMALTEILDLATYQVDLTSFTKLASKLDRIRYRADIALEGQRVYPQRNGDQAAAEEERGSGHGNS